MLEISIVTLSWNRKEDLREVLLNIKKQNFQNYEIIVVDNSSIDGTKEMLDSEFNDLRVIKLNKNIGIKGYNIGMQKSKGKYVVLIDNDMILVNSDSLTKIKNFFEENEKLGAVAFKVMDWESQKISLNSPKYILSNDRKSGFKASVFDGGGVAIRKSVLKKVGYYPEEFFMYQNEIDLSTKIWNAGFEIRYFPDITVIHKWSPRSRNNKKFLYLWHRNYLWYVFKYFPFYLAIIEIFMFLVANIGKSIREGYFKIFLQALFSAFLNLPKIYKKRKKIKPEILIMMHRIRVKHYLRENNLSHLKPKKKGFLRFLFWRFYYQVWRIETNE